MIITKVGHHPSQSYVGFDLVLVLFAVLRLSIEAYLAVSVISLLIMQVNVATGEQKSFAAGLLPPANQQQLGEVELVVRPGHHGQLLLARQLPSLQVFDYLQGRTESVLRVRDCLVFS